MKSRPVNRPKKGAPLETAPEKPSMKTHELVLSSTVHSAVGVHAWSKFMGAADVGALVLDLRERVKQVQDGDLKSVEAMLYGQAMTLQTIFTSLAIRANEQGYLKQFQAYLTLALKAQSQCRATLEALAEIKNPRPVAFVKQANISGGHQQINNGTAAEGGTIRAGAHAHAHAAKNLSPQNELLETPHGNDLDTRAQGTAGRADPHMEAVAAGHRAAHA